MYDDINLNKNKLKIKLNKFDKNDKNISKINSNILNDNIYIEDIDNKDDKIVKDVPN